MLAAIDVGTNAVRLEIAKPLPDGSLETLHQERDAVRPGEGVFKTGSIPPATAHRLLATLRRYSALCRRYGARVKAVATSAVREANNRDAILRMAKEEAGLDLEIVSGREEARLICLGVLHGKPAKARSLVIDIGGGSTEIALAQGENPTDLWTIPLGAVRLTEIFESSGKVSPQRLELMRSFAEEACREALSHPIRSLPKTAHGSSGTINSLVSYAAAEGTGYATATQITRAVEKLADMSLAERRKVFDPKRAEIIVAGAVVLETVLRHLHLASVTAVSRGLRDGILVDLLRRVNATPQDSSLADAALSMGRRFHFDEAHALEVRRIALKLFDDLASLHGLPAAARPLLELASLLHDIGHSVSSQKHHKHTGYLIQNADLPGITVREREVTALVARFHRRSPPDRNHPALAEVSPSEIQTIRKLSTLLRIADSLDRSHNQPVRDLRVGLSRAAVSLHLTARAPLDLELWDVDREAPLFRRVFARRLELTTTRARSRK